ncbi:MAG: hypothetical protein WBB28_15265 [Crinalium sp.]
MPDRAIALGSHHTYYPLLNRTNTKSAIASLSSLPVGAMVAPGIVRVFHR